MNEFSHTSHQLFRLLAQGSEPAFRSIFEQYRERLLFTVLRLVKIPAVAEEIVQDVFVSIWVNQKKFTDIADPESYIFTIAYNRIYTVLKKTAKENQLLEELLYFMQQEQFSLHDTILANESKALVEAAIESLPPQRKLVFQLSRNEGLTHDQIAQRLDISRNTVRNHIIEAMRDIRKYLGHTALALLLHISNHS